MNIEPIAFFRSPFTSKFGIPRQSGIVSELKGRIEFVPRYAQPEALRGLDQYDYLWLVWGFSERGMSMGLFLLFVMRDKEGVKITCRCNVPRLELQAP